MSVMHDEFVKLPVHITGFFKPYYSDDPTTTGSVGAGLILTPGIEFRFRRGNGKVMFNGEYCKIRPALNLSTKLKEAFVEIFTSLKPGVGYAISAASTLAVALSYAWLSGTSVRKLAMDAHISEVEHRTGLGDVISILEGSGLVVREKPGGPGIGKTRSYERAVNMTVVTTDLGSMETEIMLSTINYRLQTYGEMAMRIFEAQPSLEGFLEASSWFSEKVGFMTPEISELLKPIKHMIIGSYIKKKVLLVVPEPDLVYEVKEYLKSVFGHARIFRIGDNSWMKSLELIQGIIH
ncbi:MAG: hypothetical protein QXI27_00405 [Nitrososphaerota archaeon]